MGEKLDGRSDIFSLGVVAFEMLSGQQPFPGANVTSILYRLVHVDPVEPANLEMNGLVPQKWREVFHKVLAKKAENRYQTASAFVQDLEYCLGSWFTGLGDEETISLQMPVPDETTVAIPQLAAPVPPAAARGDAPAAESDTLVLPGPPPAEEAEPDTTLVLVEEPPQEETVRLPPARAIEELVAGPTVVMAPPAGSQTLPPEPTVRDLAPAPATTARPAPRAGVPVGWAMGGLAVVAALALGIVGWAVWQRSQAIAPAVTAEPPAPVAEASPEPVAPLPTLGTLQVESEPSGARVRVNGQATGQTPLRLGELPLGAYEIRLEQKGYEAQTRAVSLQADSPSAEVRVALARPAAPASGAADILSTPTGAEVSVDGRPVGTTPLSGLKLKPGTHRVEVALTDHETWTGSVDVAAGQTGRVEVRLRAIAKPPPAPPTPEPVDTARVYENTPGEVDAPAKKLSGSSPSYPSDRAGRLKSGERVSVVVRIVVSETGEVQDVSVVESGGKAVDDVVVSAIHGWKFQPATKRGTRVKVQVAFRQTFLGG